MALDAADWDRAFSTKNWGRWPSEHVVRQVSAVATKPLSVLEVGCGPGPQLRYLSEEGHFAVGIDISSVALARCAAWLRALGIPPCLVEANGVALPVRSGAFDLVVDTEAFIYSDVESQRILWREAARVLRESGSVISLGFAPGTCREAIPESWTLTEIEPATVADFAEDAGLKVVDQQFVTRTTGPQHEMIVETITRALKPAVGEV